MEYFNVDDIIEHLQAEFPELTAGTIARVAKGSLREIAKRAETGRPASINARMMNSVKGLDLYAVFMPAPDNNQYSKIFKLDTPYVKGKRKK